MNPDLRKLAETYLLSESVSHKEWRALVVKMLADALKPHQPDGFEFARRCAAEISKERQREADRIRRWDNVEMTGGLLAIGFFILLYLFYMRAA
jgi:hypothetical protein